jgi:hypothetical protein
MVDCNNVAEGQLMTNTLYADVPRQHEAQVLFTVAMDSISCIMLTQSLMNHV